MDYHFARLMWLITNTMRGEDPLPLSDFMPFMGNNNSDDEPVIAAHPAVTMFEQMYAKFHEND
jgi:hypothetical protein